MDRHDTLNYYLDAMNLIKKLDDENPDIHSSGQFYLLNAFDYLAAKYEEVGFTEIK